MGYLRPTSDTGEILRGSSDEQLLAELYRRISPPANETQRLYGFVWEVTGYIASDGFEWLFEQQVPLDDFAARFAEIGFPEGSDFVQRAAALVPAPLLEAGDLVALFKHIRSQFEPFKALLQEYLAVADRRLLPALGDFVRRNRQDFAGLLE
jgi:hypothetical protein